MKAFLLLSVLLSGVLAITAAAVEAPEAATVVEVPEAVEAAPQELQEINQNEDPDVFSTGEIISAAEVRFSSCPFGWKRHEDTCYWFEGSNEPWSSAASICASQGASLPSVKDVVPYKFLQSESRQAGFSSAWLGGFYFENRWRWLDQSSFYEWVPIYNGKIKPCLYLSATENWSSSVCSTPRPFICMKKIVRC